MKLWIRIETFISNLPLTVGAIALAIVTLGVVWFKFAEENLDSCQPVHFHSSQCTFPEFPGCFYCDTTSTLYKVAVDFHFACSIIAGILAVVFFAKVFLATRVVLDEMSSPTTASPAGLICMTIVCVFAGRGLVGQILVSAAAALHLCLAIWFIYMALACKFLAELFGCFSASCLTRSRSLSPSSSHADHIMPEPSWFPNTVGIGLSAVKTWLYYPMPGHLLMAVSEHFPEEDRLDSPQHACCEAHLTSDPPFFFSLGISITELFLFPNLVGSCVSERENELASYLDSNVGAGSLAVCPHDYGPAFLH